MALTDYLTQQIKDPLLDVDPAWRQFVIDHKAVIIAGGTQQSISPEVMTQCNYNLQRYLRYINVQPSIAWVVLLVNDLDSDIDFSFDMVSYVITMPNEDFLSTLYQTYQTVSQLQ